MMVSKVIPRREEKCPCPLLSNVVSYDLQVMKEMSEVDSEDLEDESDPETNDSALPEFEDPNVGDFLIGLKGSRLRYQVAFAKRALKDPKLKMLSLRPFLHAAWHLAPVIGVSTCSKLLE